MHKRTSGAAELAVLTIACLTIFSALPKAAAQNLPPPSTGVSLPDDGFLELQLEVFVNGAPTELIAAFRQTSDGLLLIELVQLKNVGINPAKEAIREDGWVDIGRLPGVVATYDEENQTLSFDAIEKSRAARIIDAQADEISLNIEEEEAPVATSNLGGLVNYTLFGATGGEEWDDLTSFQGLSGLFEGRLFGPYGVLSSSQIASSSDAENFGSTRLDTRWSYSDPKRLMTYNVGDIISGGLSWTRPTRLGGIQIRRNFTLRPDLVTMPLPEISGSAAVPSTVDVYVNNAQNASRSVPSGPFSITNLPIVTGAGTARLVVRDALGRETISETPFYASSNLLTKGLLDFSAELGFARRYYGVESNDYDDRPVGSATMRYGLNNHFTLEAHVEGAENFYNAGAGSVFNIGTFGIGSVAASSSRFGSETGYQIAASVEAELWNVKFFARTQRTFGDYNDIASITADIRKFGLPSTIYSTKPPRSLDQASISLPAMFENLNFNFSYTELETANFDKSRLLGMTATKAIGQKGNVFVTAFTDFERKGSFGVFAGLSWMLDGNITASSSVSSNESGTSVTADLMKSEQASVGSTGWRLRGSHGESDILAASGSYRSSVGRAEGGVEKFNDNIRGTAQFEGALILAGGGAFLSNRVDDAFSVVDVGAPGVDVFYENRPIGKTNRSGKLLVPDLRSYEDNSISIDPSNLPLDASVGTTRQVVRPSDRGGAVVDFNVSAQTRPALITVRNEAGDYVETGATAQLNGGENTIVGYDGQIYVENIEKSNNLTVQQSNGESCSVAFTAPAITNERTIIPDAICRKEL
ncbi:fimbria/pilus outer membrane usher protein [Brucella thiophenivorans]|uniref:PapC C-terminal domain protein n=1 Tax=Brucella thiophenivorans TaxID=571255 RepID=A0A256FX19_9HYPH|nr:fimbria/pilus outer membrane usher protein [Brucella thiophenivorans]OYR19399.1 papC C-terminal domain protein [Brucella thiophenivorans]